MICVEEHLDTQKHLVQNCADIIKLIHNLFQENCNFATLSVGSGSKFRTSYIVEKFLTFIIPPAGIIELKMFISIYICMMKLWFSEWTVFIQDNIHF